MQLLLVLVTVVAGIALAFREIPVPVRICCCRVINLIENSILFVFTVCPVIAVSFFSILLTMQLDGRVEKCIPIQN